jgi:hypothetical protein
MKRLLLVLTLLAASSLPSAEKAQPDTSSWTNKMNTPFFVSVVPDKSDYDGLGVAAKNNVEKYLGDSSYRFKTEKDGTAFILEISKTPKDKIEMKIYDASTSEGIVPATQDKEGKDVIKKFAKTMETWDKNGALYKVIFQDISFTDIKPIKENMVAKPNYGGQWQMSSDAVLLTYKGTADALIDAFVSGPGNLEPLSVDGRKITFKVASGTAVKEQTKEKEKTKEQPKEQVKEQIKGKAKNS